MKQTFELTVAWRYLRERGSRAGKWTMGVGVLSWLIAFGFSRLGLGLAALHSFELTDSQAMWRQVYETGKIISIVVGAWLFFFGFFHRLQSIFTTISTFGVWLGTAALVIVLS